MSTKSAKNVCKIFSKNYMKSVQNVNIFSVEEQGQENRRTQNVIKR